MEYLRYLSDWDGKSFQHKLCVSRVRYKHADTTGDENIHPTGSQLECKRLENEMTQNYKENRYLERIWVTCDFRSELKVVSTFSHSFQSQHISTHCHFFPFWLGERIFSHSSSWNPHEVKQMVVYLDFIRKFLFLGFVCCFFSCIFLFCSVKHHFTILCAFWLLLLLLFLFLFRCKFDRLTLFEQKSFHQGMLHIW